MSAKDWRIHAIRNLCKPRPRKKIAGWNVVCLNSHHNCPELVEGPKIEHPRERERDDMLKYELIAVTFYVSFAFSNN